MSANYSALLKDPRWQRKRLEIFQRDGFACRLCGATDRTLNAHHLWYDRGAKPWEYDETALVTVCDECHEELHVARFGDFIPSLPFNEAQRSTRFATLCRHWERAMRDYAKVSPQFWTGDTGKFLRGLGPRAQVIAMYLMTCPSATMLGLYYLPLPTLCHETASPSKEALKDLRRLSQGGFSYYDEASEHVFVPEMARFQIGESLTKRDNRHKALLRELDALKKSPFFKHFLDRYRDAYELHDLTIEPSTPSLFEAPLEPLRSQEQEQEKEQKKEKATRRARATPLPEGFAVSPRVEAWAKSKGFDRLDEHLDAFTRKARAKGYTYVDWDSAFEEAIREDWGGIRSGKGRSATANGDWASTEAGILAKGAELRMARRDGEGVTLYRDRIKQRLERRAA